MWLMSWEFPKDTLIRSFASLMSNWRDPASLLWRGKFPEHFGKRSSTVIKQCRQHKEGKRMPAYKDEKRNTWLSLFYYEDWQGNKKIKQKRGFKTKKEALE